VGLTKETLAPTFCLAAGCSGGFGRHQYCPAPGPEPRHYANARGQQNTQTQDIAHFLDQLHSQLDAVGREREELKRREQEVARREEPAGERGSEGMAGQGTGPGTATAVVT